MEWLRQLGEACECSLCSNEYDEESRCPRLLPCGHSFCSICLKELVRKVEQGENPEHQAKLECPKDRKETLMKTSQVSCLAKNFALLELLYAARLASAAASPAASPAVLCDLCFDDDGGDGNETANEEGGENRHAALFRCLDCRQNMCSMTKNAHKRTTFTANHRVVSLAEIAADPSTVSGPSVVCNEHNDVFRYFDKDCQIPICRDCHALEHSNHTCQSLKQATAEWQEKLSDLAENATGNAAKLLGVIENVTAVKEELEHNVERAQDEIVAAFNEVRKQANKREKELLDQLNATSKARLFALTNQLETLQMMRACLESAAKRATTTTTTTRQGERQQETGDMIAILTTGTDLTTSLAALTTQQATMRVHQPVDSGYLMFRSSKDERQQLLSLVKTMGLLTPSAVDLSQSLLTGPTEVLLGSEFEFTVTVRDDSGSIVREVGECLIAEMVSGGAHQDAGGGGATATFEQAATSPPKMAIVDVEDGSYALRSRFPKDDLKFVGDWLVSVRVAGLSAEGGHIKHSPFSFTLAPPVQTREFHFTGAIEHHQITFAGRYKITVRGAQGADSNHSGNNKAWTGGSGAIISAVFSLAKGQTLRLLCGGAGSNVGTSSDRRYGSGGGGSYVSVVDQEGVLIVAGGGGGSDSVYGDGNGLDASVNEDGVDAQGQCSSKGGRNGQGGASGSQCGGGGAGLLSPGQACTNYSTCTAAQTFSQNGRGGTEPQHGFASGGFGGGGSAPFGAGGGGFSGGGGGSRPGGGGSFVSETAVAVVSKTVGHRGNGSITIELAM